MSIFDSIGIFNNLAMSVPEFLYAYYVYVMIYCQYSQLRLLPYSI